MKINNRLITGAGGLAIAAITRSWMCTLDYRIYRYDDTADPVLPEFEGSAIFLFWHEYIPFMFYLRGHSDIAMLLSAHQDAEWLSQATRHMGFKTIRGSTNRGGAAALRRMFQKGDQNLTIAPDGPRGPRRRLAPGAVYLSSRLGVPIVCAGLGYDRPWRYRRAWDQFAVPRPYSRARSVSGPKIQVPAGIDRHQLESWRKRIEIHLNQLTKLAEEWAESGRRVAGEAPLRREGMPLERRRQRRGAAAAEPDRALDERRAA